MRFKKWKPKYETQNAKKEKNEKFTMINERQKMKEKKQKQNEGGKTKNRLLQNEKKCKKWKIDHVINQKK